MPVLQLQDNQQAQNEVAPWNLGAKTPYLPVSNPDADYAVVIFMAGDCKNLAEQVLPDIREMLLGSKGGRELSVLIFTDVMGSPHSRVLEVSSKGVLTLFQGPPVDTGDPRPIAEFLSHALGSYSPETKIALGFWGHGQGIIGDFDPFENLLPDQLRSLPLGSDITDEMFLKHYLPTIVPPIPSSRSILPDASTGNSLTNRELSSALAVAFARSGRTEPVDMIFFDACLSGSVEVYAEVRRYAKTFVASALNIPGKGWNYTWFLQATRRQSPQTAEEWAVLALLAFDMAYDQRFYPKPAQLMALRTDSDLLEKFQAVNQKIISSESSKAEVFRAIGCAQAVGQGETLDLGQLMIGLYSTTENPELKQACSDFLDSKDRAMLGLSMAPKKGELYTGLTIWVPLQGDSDGVSRYYDKLQFHKETGWFDVITFLFGKPTPPRS